MRLTCPDCEAQYQVDSALIPPEGRTVECARCGNRWHQAGAAPQPILLGDPDTSPEVEPDLPDPPTPPTDPATIPRPSESVLAILREEADRELAQRAVDRARAATQDVGPADEPEAAAPAHRPSPEPEFIVAELVEDHELPGHASPDRAQPEPEAQAVDHPRGDHSDERPRRWGYNAGFAVAVVIALLAGGAYVAAPRLADAGGVGAALSDYRQGADRVRLWLFDRATSLVGRTISAPEG